MTALCFGGDGGRARTSPQSALAQGLFVKRGRAHNASCAGVLKAASVNLPASHPYLRTRYALNCSRKAARNDAPPTAPALRASILRQTYGTRKCSILQGRRGVSKLLGTSGLLGELLPSPTVHDVQFCFTLPGIRPQTRFVYHRCRRPAAIEIVVQRHSSRLETVSKAVALPVTAAARSGKGFGGFCCRGGSIPGLHAEPLR
jgi:hypothetical protein